MHRLRRICSSRADEGSGVVVVFLIVNLWLLVWHHSHSAGVACWEEVRSVSKRTILRQCWRQGGLSAIFDLTESMPRVQVSSKWPGRIL